jgi:hypothetical protein
MADLGINDISVKHDNGSARPSLTIAAPAGQHATAKRRPGHDAKAKPLGRSEEASAPLHV